MSEAVFYPRGDGYRKARAKPASGRAKLLKTLILVCAACVALELVYVFAFKNSFPITKVNLNDFLGFSQASLLETAGISGKEGYFSIDTREIEARLESIPRVASATVVKRFPDTLAITLVSRTPCAVIFGTDEGGKSVPYYADASGKLFRSGAAVESLPVLSGIAASEMVEGKALPDKYLGVLRRFAEIASTAPGLLDMFSEFRFDRSEYGMTALTIFPMNSPVRIRTSDVLTPDLLKYSLLAADIMDRQGLTKRVNEIDFRSGTVVYRDSREGGTF